MSSLKKISLKDIAEAAGVSTALVSFVLNGKKKEYRVGEETAQRILKIANEMNYQPNLAAKSLRSGKTKTIGILLFTSEAMDFSELSQGTMMSPSTPLLIRLLTTRVILSLSSSELPKSTVYPRLVASSSNTRAN